MVKSTYVLDVETAQTLDRLARSWQVSKSEALRRAIRAAGAESGAGEHRVTVFRSLQKAAGLSRATASRWAGAVRAERRAASGRTER